MRGLWLLLSFCIAGTYAMQQDSSLRDSSSAYVCVQQMILEGQQYIQLLRFNGRFNQAEFVQQQQQCLAQCLQKQYSETCIDDALSIVEQGIAAIDIYTPRVPPQLLLASLERMKSILGVLPDVQSDMLTLIQGLKKQISN